MIHSRDPKRQTDGKLISTAYYYKMLQLMKRFATLQGFTKDVAEFDALATHIKDYIQQAFPYGKEGNFLKQWDIRCIRTVFTMETIR
ncbi:MAG: hypothetical protein R2738_07350 [Bacteroides graminisolvens]